MFMKRWGEKTTGSYISFQCTSFEITRKCIFLWKIADASFKHLCSSMGLQHCYMISIWWTDWKSFIEVWFHYLLRRCTRTKLIFSKTQKREKKTKKQKQTSIAFMTSFYRLRAYKEDGGGAHILYAPYERTP